MILSTLIIVVLLIGINGLYVTAEFAAVGVRKSRIRQLANEGNAIARLLLPWIEDSRLLDRYVAVCQIGITLSSLTLGAFSQATLTPSLAGLFLHQLGMQEFAAVSLAAGVVLITLTVLQVVLGELVPKSLALQYSSSAALYTFLPMRWSLAAFSFLSSLLNGSALLLLKLLRIPQTAHRHIHSPEEIEMLIAESRDGGILEPDEHQRLQRALRLGKRPAHQLMVPRRYMAAIAYETPVEEVLREIVSSPYSHLPVYQGSMDNVIGMVHTKDVVMHYIDQGGITSIEEIMRPVLSVPEHATADSLLYILRQKRTHQAVVVDEFGGTEGLLTLEDVLTEMLGEVADEFKMDQPQPERLPDGRVRLPGLMRLDVAEPWLGVLWEGEADTLGGHVIEMLGKVPAPQERLVLQGVEVEVEKVVHHAVVSILAKPVGAALEERVES